MYFVANFGISVHIETLSTSTHMKIVLSLNLGHLGHSYYACLLQILSLSSNHFPASLISEIIHLKFDNARIKLRTFNLDPRKVRTF